MNEEYDVCVAGGGSAGLAAAVAAARLGARTLLVERHGVLGGMASAALVHSVCGLYRLPGPDEPPSLANNGFAAEFGRRLLAAGQAEGPVRMGRVDVLLHRPAGFVRLADQIARTESERLTTRLHTEIIAADAFSVTLSCRGVIRTIRARAWVDATGDAVLSTMRGAASDMAASGHLQRPAFIFALGGVDSTQLDDNGRMRLARKLVVGTRTGLLPPGVLGAHFRASPQSGEAFVSIDLTGGPNYDPLDPACLTQVEIEGRDIAEQLTVFLQSEAEGFAGCYVAAWPTRAGVRESRRVVGRTRIETKDIARGADFADGVACSAWPMEFRETTSGPRLRFPAENRSCAVPLGALRAKDDPALFVAGRCLSCSHEAQAALRVIGTCLATGEAAGLAAALYVDHGECDAQGVLTARQQIER